MSSDLRNGLAARYRRYHLLSRLAVAGIAVGAALALYGAYAGTVAITASGLVLMLAMLALAAMQGAAFLSDLAETAERYADEARSRQLQARLDAARVESRCDAMTRDLPGAVVRATAHKE